MKLIPEQSIKLYEDGFGENDLLSRKHTGEALSDLLNRFENPLVVALDGKWGSGKTWFLQRWVGEHTGKNIGSIVIYFDAFAHDHVGDPLPALVSALEKRTSDKDRETMKQIKEVGLKLIRPAVRIGLAALTAGASEGVQPVVESMKEEAEEYWNREAGRSQAMVQFRGALSSLASKNSVIFVVDELDRCRPDYALEVLEIIKHFFSVDNVHFVLGVNLKALEDMVSTRYGANINAREYLQKFIRIKLELPEENWVEEGQNQNVLTYLDYLCREMEVPDHIGKWLKIRIRLVSRANPVSLRHIEHIVSAVTLASSEALDYKYENFYYASIYSRKIPEGRFAVMVDLIIAKIVCPELYPRFLDATITPDDLKSYLGNSDSLPILHPKYHSEKRLRRENPESLSDHEYDKVDWNWASDTWLLITQAVNEIPVLGNVLPDRKREIGRSLFGSEFVPDNFPESRVKELPKKIQHEWLDLFRFFKTDL